MTNSQKNLFPDHILFTEGFDYIATGQFAFVEFEQGRFALCQKHRKVGANTKTNYGETWKSVPVITKEMQQEIHVSVTISSEDVTF